MAWLSAPLGYEFFRHGMLAAVLVGALCGLIGVFIVLRRMSYIGHGLAHAVLGGAVVGYVLQVNFYVAAGLWGFLAALLINATTRRREIASDAAIGVVTTASFALGVALISRLKSYTRNFEAALFGNVLGVTTGDLWIVGVVATGTALIVLLFYKQLLFTTFDAEVAAIFGVPSEWIDTLFALVLAAAIIAATQVMGVTLIAAAIVVPAIIARLITSRFATMLWLSTVLGAACGVCGMYVSYYVDVSSGATIVLVGALAFAVVFAFTSLRARLQPASVRLPSLLSEEAQAAFD